MLTKDDSYTIVYFVNLDQKRNQYLRIPFKVEVSEALSQLIDMYVSANILRISTKKVFIHDYFLCNKKYRITLLVIL